MKALWIGLLILLSCLFELSAQDLVSYTDTANRFSIAIPRWTPLSQAPNSSIKLYLYDSSSASPCTAQTWLSLRITKGTGGFRLQRHVKATVNADSTKGILSNGARWSVRSDSVICRPGELEYKIAANYVTFTWPKGKQSVSLSFSSEHMRELLPMFMTIAESFHFF